MSAAAPSVLVTAPTSAAPLLHVQDLRVSFPTADGVVHALRGVNLALLPGESVAILGESGSGKSVMSRALLGLIDPPARVTGSIAFQGQTLPTQDSAAWRDLRGSGIAMVFQDALDSLNPVFSIGSQLMEILRVRLHLSRIAARDTAVRLLQQVGIAAAEERFGDYPHQFSGGMRQRVCIAMAIALQPKLLIADEPTTALDVSVQAGILRLLARLQREAGMALIFVTHDLSVARRIAHRMIVMYAGQIVEQGQIEAIFRRPAHPYTKGLLASRPGAVDHWTALQPIVGSPPDKGADIAGCSFHPRCPNAEPICRADAPVLQPLAGGRLSRCHFFRRILNAGHEQSR
jgi:oligopeptide transport system ATP-binding protein